MGGRRYKKSSYKKKLKIIAINVILFLAMQTVVGFAFSIPMVYYGPFNNIKETVVQTAMTTLSHQYLATMFLSSTEINRIMEKNKVDGQDMVSDSSAIAVSDGSIEKKESQVELINIGNDKITGYILLVRNPAMVRIASTSKVGVKGMKLLDIVRENNAIGGINAGGFEDDGGHGNGGTPIGMLMQDGKVIYGDSGTKYSIIGFNDNSQLVLGKYTPEEAIQQKIRDAVSFGPFLIINGEPLIKGSSNGGWGLAPRTAIGQRKDGTVIMLVIDGRQLTSVGATLKDVQDLMLQYGAYNAANLDGGASTAMVYEDRIINSPSSKYGDRPLPSAFIISK